MNEQLFPAEPGFTAIYRNREGEEMHRAVVMWKRLPRGLWPVTIAASYYAGISMYPAAVIHPDGHVEAVDDEARWANEIDFDSAVARADTRKK